MGTIDLTDIHKFFDDVHVIKGVDLQINEGEFVVFVGPSGCGKSTMLRLIAGLEEITSGSITIDGNTVTGQGAAERGLAMVFQSYALYPHMSVRENMGFGLKVAGESTKIRDEAVNRAADILQLGPLMERKPKELSGGQRQRVAIGRAIVREPAAFLFDGDKCKLLTIGNRRISSSYQLTSKDKVYSLECVNEMKDLGVTIDSNLNFNSHIQCKVNKANQTMGMIRRAFTHLDKEMFLCLFKAFVRPQLEYANAAWEKLTNVNRSKLQAMIRTLF